MKLVDRRVATLAAVFAPAAASSLLARYAGEGGAELVAHAARLVSAPRAERLRALAAALTPDAGLALAAAEEAAPGERPRVAAVLRSVASGAAPAANASPVLLRLCRERIAR